VGKTEITRPRYADKILEFCKTARTAGEVAKLIGYKSIANIRKIYLIPLIANGEMQYTIPEKPLSRSQLFVTMGYEADMVTKEAVLEFCRIPRRKNEIAAQFKQSKYQMRFIVTPLIENGKLLPCDESVNNNAWKRFVSADAGIPMDRVQQLKEFCREPRSRKEIAVFLRLSTTRTYEFLREQVEANKLKLTMPERPQSMQQKFVATEVDIHILTADIIEFCQTARTRSEVAERYGLSRRTASTYLCEFIQKGILNYTVPEYILSRKQKYIAA
jgi:hypothetical protein